MDCVALTSDFLEDYRGRDKVMRMLGYASGIGASFATKPLQAKFKIFSTALSQCRVVLRLFDDLPMLRNNLIYGFGFSDEDLGARIFRLLKNLLDQIYYLVEHVSWCSSNGIISENFSIPSRLACLLIWGSSLFCNIIINIRKMRNLRKHQKGTREQTYRKKTELMKSHLLSILPSICDFINCVSWLPIPVLWAGKVSPLWNAVLGTVSSAILLRNTYVALPDKCREVWLRRKKDDTNYY